MAATGNETLSGFTKNFKALTAEFGKDDAKLKGVLERASGWVSWATEIQTNKHALPAHWSVVRSAMYDVTANLLRRKFTGEGAGEEVACAETWLRLAAELAARDAWRSLPEVDRLWPLLANPAIAF
jgi:hypothetical protein